jgi:hypothetical protein
MRQEHAFESRPEDPVSDSIAKTAQLQQIRMTCDLIWIMSGTALPGLSSRDATVGRAAYA